MANNNERISRKLSYILRHKPESLDLELDGEGYTTIELDELAKRLRCSPNVILEIVKTDKKQRFSIKHNKIRANYGHSLPNLQAIQYEEVSSSELPIVLYHGTTQTALRSITHQGITSQKRMMVHLSLTKNQAIEVARRRHGPHVLLKIDVEKMIQIGNKFYKGGPNTILTQNVPPGCFDVEEL